VVRRQDQEKEITMKKITLLFLVLILAACASGGETGTELSRNQQKWDDANVTHYTFQLGVSCFCPVGGVMPMTVEVKDGEVVSLVDVNGNAFPSTDPLNELIQKYATIDRILAELASASVQEAERLEVAYDPTYGFPTDVTIDFVEQVADDELYLSVSAFEPLP
jgi:hypothetical protein